MMPVLRKLRIAVLPVFFFGAMAAALISGCGEDTTGPEDDSCSLGQGEQIRIIYPKGGETFTVGNKVTVKFAYNTDGTIPGLKMILSTDNGATFPGSHLIIGDMLQPTDTIPPSTGCGEFDWTIGSGDDIIPYADVNTVKLKGESYTNSSLFGMTGSFTIKK